MIKFLPLNVIIAFHDDQIRLYGGSTGIRDKGLLESALAQPQMSFDGKYIYKDIFEMAAAYGYHACKNHPFYDGNKRTALLAMYTFLYVNGWKIVADKKELYVTIYELASGNVTKEELISFLKNNSRKIET